jgi:indolepyruvate ferredoxin oxidoreductase beta subunit
MEVYNLFLCGTGGQGIVLAGRIIASVAFKSGFDVRESEIHGMSQRGGTVTGHVRFGKVVYSPIIPLGQADAMLALEELEALRYCHYLKKSALIILNARRVLPAALPEEQYPKHVEERLKNKGYRVFKVQASEVAKELGSSKIENTVLLGVLSQVLPFKPETWEEVIATSVPPKTVELNLKAFREGRKIGEALLQPKD